MKHLRPAEVQESPVEMHRRNIPPPGFQNPPDQYQNYGNSTENPQYRFHCDPPFSGLAAEYFASGRETRNVLPRPSSLIRVISRRELRPPSE